jgi:hypothetical protein
MSDRWGRGNEKGGVEEEGGYFRRNHLVPLPAARDLEHLNELLLASCKEEEPRIIAGREQTIGAAMAIEREHLQPLPGEGFDLAASTRSPIGPANWVGPSSTW